MTRVSGRGSGWSWDSSWPGCSASARPRPRSRKALASARGVDRELALRLEAQLAHAERYDLSGEAESVARLARLAAGVAGETPAERLVLAMDAALRPARDAAEAATFAARVEAGWNEQLVSLRAATGAVATYLYAGELERARTFAEALLADARRRSLVFAHARASSMVAMVALASGRVADAEAALVAAVEIETYGMPRPAVAVLIEVLVEMDRLEEAATALVSYAGGRAAAREDAVEPAAHGARAVCAPRCTGRRTRSTTCSSWAGATTPGVSPAGRCRHGEASPARSWRPAASRSAPTSSWRNSSSWRGRWGSEHAIGVALRDLGTVQQDTDALTEAARLLAATPFRLDHAYALVELGRRCGAIAAARRRSSP